MESIPRFRLLGLSLMFVECQYNIQQQENYYSGVALVLQYSTTPVAKEYSSTTSTKFQVSFRVPPLRLLTPSTNTTYNISTSNEVLLVQ
mgnify:CR=1 FL=1